MQIDWSKITLGTFNKIEAITSAELSDDEKTNRLIEVIFGIKAETLSIKDYLKKVKELTFLQEKIVPSRVKSKYKIGKNEYTFDVSFTNFTISQFIDFTNLKKNNGKVNELIGCFLIPIGKEYGDYDRVAVNNDILNMSVEEAFGITNFFIKQLAGFYKIFRFYSIRKIMKTKLTWKQKKMMIQALNKSIKLNQMITEYYPTYSNTVK